jgi:hypothetical protein
VIRPEFRNNLENQQKVLVTLWFAFLVIILFFLWIPQLLPELLPIFIDYPSVGSVRTVLWLFAVGEIGFLFWWEKRFLSREAIFQRPSFRFFPNMVKGHQTPEEEKLGRILSNYLLGKVLGFAISESIAIYGLVLAYIDSFPWDQYLLSLISVLLLVYFYPSRSFFDSLIREVG